MVATPRRPRCALCFGRPARRGSGGKPKAGVVSRAWRTRKCHYQHTMGSRSSSRVKPTSPRHHQGIETIAYMLDGECAVYYGHDLANRGLGGQGEQCFVAADVPHAPDNESGKPCTWIVVHSSGKRFRMASCCCPSLMPNWRAG